MFKTILRFFSNITNKQAIIIIIIIACFHAINSFIILNNNQFYSYLSEDVTSIVDMSTSFVHEYNIINHLTNKKSISETAELISSYWKPPLFFLFSLPFLIIIKNINFFIVILNLFISLITLLSVYGIVKQLHSIQAGLFSSYILSFCPLFFAMHRTFFIETLLTAIIVASIYLIFTNKFESLRYNIFFTFALTAGILTKEQFFIYFLIFILFIFIKKDNYTNIIKLTNIFLTFCCAVILSYIVWYYRNAFNIFEHLLKYASETINSDYLFYIKSLYYFDISFIISILLILSFIYFLFKTKYFSLIISFMFILFVFSLSGNKVSRHIFPVILFIPILISLFIFKINNIYFKRILIIVISFLLFVQFLFINYSDCRYFRQGNFNGYNSLRGIIYYSYKPAIETYKGQYKYLNEILGNNFETNTIFIQTFTPLAYNFLILQKDRNKTLCEVKTYNDIAEIKRDIHKYSNILISNRDKNIFQNFEKWLLENTDFKQIKKINIYNHDNAEIYLYQNNKK